MRRRRSPRRPGAVPEHRRRHGAAGRALPATTPAALDHRRSRPTRCRRQRRGARRRRAPGWSSSSTCHWMKNGRPLAKGRVVSHEMPAELHPVRPRAAHRQRLVAGPPRGSFDVVGPEAQRTGTLADLGETSLHPRADRAGRGLVAVDDGHQLDVAAAERHDAVARAVPDVATAGDRRQPVLVVVATGRRLEILDDDDHMVDGQHVLSEAGSARRPPARGRRAAARTGRSRPRVRGRFVPASSPSRTAGW